MDDEFDSVADRQKVTQARVHSELTATARERVCQQTLDPLNVFISNPLSGSAIPPTLIGRAISRTYENTGYSALEPHLVIETPEAHKTFPADQSIPSKEVNEIKSHREIVENADTITVLAYLEHLITFVRHSREHKWDQIVSHGVLRSREKRVPQLVKRINTALETEGVLWKLTNDNQGFNFRPIGSELLEESDKEFSRITEDQRWKSVVSPYESAFELYKDRQYTYQIPEKLYNSIEELARTIVVDLEGWEDNREMNLQKYLNSMRDNGLFEPNNIMYAELNDLISSMEKAFQKSGAHRKNRHQEIGREYSTLLLHQISAYLTYIIRMYENKYDTD
ncbi:hypothetical protein SAMN04487950_3846 [Halogranum rubrum]|uniref:Abortive infection C-terminus n=1 Tax=Halogranum rubrum TaxID=553466 RepID=A0A1I4HUG4_9EURY|nr:hypothetical protein [Halogranum rubrum]SFL45795.1 hypothetical protein SAMN04487950_3846 [Halogranum rubrum]